MERWSFGIDNNYLIDLVKTKKKTATSYLYNENDLPIVGEESIICFDDKKDACIIKTIDYKVLKFKDMTEELAKLEGEGDLSLKYWKDVHYNFFKAIKQDFTEEDKIIFEIFELVEKVDYMDINNYYFHTILKDNTKDEIYKNFEDILKDRKLKSQKLLNNNEMKFNGIDYISLASYKKESEYKTFIIDENEYSHSKLSTLFDTYDDYLNYLKQDNWLEKPLSKEEFFEKYNTTNKREYYNYLDSIARTYPIDIKYLYKKTNDLIYKDILEIINDDILYCNKSEYCFEEYIRKSKGITFIFPKNINAVEVKNIPNLPFEVENKLIKKIQHLSTRYSNQIGEVQVKDYLDIESAIGIIINEDFIDKKIISKLLIKYNFNIKIFKLKENQLIELN